MSHKVPPGIWAERSVCRVTGVLFNTVAWEEEKKRFMTSLLWRAEETEVILGLKTSLNQGCNHARGTMTNTDQHSRSAINIVFCKHPLSKDMQIFNHTGKVLKGRKTNRNLKFFYVALQAEKKRLRWKVTNGSCWQNFGSCQYLSLAFWFGTNKKRKERQTEEKHSVNVQ